MKKLLFILLSLFLSTEGSIAQEATQTKAFIIVAAGKNYQSMKKTANSVAKKLGYKINLRGLQQNSQIGLSFSKKDCEDNGFEFPAYIPRGRWDDGEYISIEYTDAYEGFSPGLYFIIVSSHDKDSKKINSVLAHVKKSYKNAYIKYADIYMGCLH